MRVQLRDKTGRLLSGSAEAEHIAQFLRQIYHSEHKTGPPSSTPITGAAFDQEELRSALARMAGSKALPASFAPARLWKLVPHLVSPPSSRHEPPGLRARARVA